MYRVIPKPPMPPRANPRAFDFFEKFWSKNLRINASELNLEWKRLIQTFLMRFRRKNKLGGVEKRTKEKTEQTAYIKTTC